VYYGALTPGKVTRQEFVAGTLKPLTKKGGPLSEVIYEDGSGRKMILLEHYFRYPADLDRLVGVEYPSEDEDETEK